MGTTQEQKPLEQPTLAQETLARVKSGLAAGQMPVMSQIVQVIREISEKADQMSVQDLSEIISRDEGTMKRILSIANTLAYNPSGVEITSIPQAVTLVGFERIRNLAISVLLLENVDQQAGVESNREMAGLSLSGGLIASQLSRRISGVEPDVAFLCGALRSYGRMLMCNLLHEDYEKTVEAAGGEGAVSDESFRKRFGLTPLELGRELLAGMQMPQLILKTLQDIPEQVREKLAGIPGGELMMTAELGLRFAETLAAQPVGPEDFGRKLADITRTYPKEFQLTANDTKALVRDVVSQIASFAQAGKFSTGNVVLFRRMDCLSEGRRPPPPFKPTPKPSPAAAVPSGPAKAPDSPPTGPLTAKRALSVLEAARNQLLNLLKEPKPDLREACTVLVQGLQRALDLQSCLVFLRQPGGNDYLLEVGQGRLLEVVGKGVVLRSGQRDVFAVPLGRGEDVLIQNPLEERMKAFIPEWLRLPGAPLPFILLPLRDAEGTYGVVCGNTTSTNTLAVASELQDELRSLRNDLSRLGRQIRSRQP